MYYGYVMVMERFHLKKCNDGKLFNITWVGRGGGVIGTLNIPIQYLKKLFVHSLIKPSRTFFASLHCIKVCIGNTINY